MYIVAEEEPQNPIDLDSGGPIVVLSSKWLTPKKLECFWPSSKSSQQFNKILQKHEDPGDDWSLIRIKRKFFETDNLILARKKAKDAECNSDLTDGESISKRKCSRPSRIVSSSEEENDDIFQHHQRMNLNVNKLDIFANPGHVNNSNIGLDSTNSNIGLDNHKTPPNNKQSTFETNSAASSSSAFEYNSMKILETILEQNKQILSWIRGQNEQEILKKNKDPLQLPVNLPITDDNELCLIEQYLQDDKNFSDMCDYFGAFAGHTITGTINQILKHTMTNKLAMTFSYRGKKGKKSFEELNLKTAIIRATKKIFKLQREKEIEDTIKVWLKHAPQRTTLQEKKILARLNSTA